MNVPAVVLALVVAVVIFVFIIPLARTKAQNESFISVSEYRDKARRIYNPFADTLDHNRPNFAMAETERDLRAASKTLNDVMSTAELQTTPDTGTHLGVLREAVTAQVPATNSVLQKAKQCAHIKGRIAGNMFTDPALKECGICLKEGTNYDQSQRGKYMGGLFIMSSDKEYQEIDAGDGPVQYLPTVGGCDSANFFATKEGYEKGLNRLDCRESGETGGFTGSTADGRKVAVSKCAQAPFSGDNIFIYDPKNRRFNVNLRVITPYGSGLTRVIVNDSRGNQVGYGATTTPGQEFVIAISNVTELQDLSINVAMETPHRPSGNPEVFQYIVNEAGTSAPGYMQTQGTAAAICERIGAQQATKDDLATAMANGAQNCNSGWASDFVGFPMRATENHGYCGGAGLVDYYGAWGNLAHSWCKGIKPPPSTKQSLFYTAVQPFFVTLGSSSSPSQADQPNKWSQYGDSYQSPFYRGILFQWENATEPINRIAGFESSIVGVNGVPTDMTTGINRVLRKLGTYTGSVMIRGPKPISGGLMGTNQYWLWGNIATDQVVRFDVKVPGVFLDPVYPEDISVAPSGPLITKPETAVLLRIDPCLEDDQKPGKYSLKCLNNLFVSSGGDPVNGKLAKENGGLAQLNKRGDSDAISNYLMNLYSLVTTGKDTSSVPGNSTSINNAAQLLFGMDLMTPCEDVAQDSQGNIMLTKKLGSLDSSCLDYLWMNTGSDRSRYDEIPSKSSLNSTYVSIAERYSGLRNTEGSKTARTNHPFQTCQRTGTLAPIGKTGTENRSVNGAIIVKATETRRAACAANPGDLRCKTGSLVDFVQDAYNNIFQNANKSVNADGEEEHVTALSQCYGIDKVPMPVVVIAKQVNGLAVWYDASDPYGNGTVPANGTRIETWVNKAGNAAYNAVATSSGYYSAAKKSLYLNNNHYNTNYPSNPTNETIFIVFNTDTPSGTNYNAALLSGYTGARGVWVGYTDGPGSGRGAIGILSSDVSWNAVTPAGSYKYGTTGLAVSVVNGGSSSISLNGSYNSSIARANYTSNQPTFLGAQDGAGHRYNFAGHAMEILIYATALSSADIRKISGYLRDKCSF